MASVQWYMKTFTLTKYSSQVSGVTMDRSRRLAKNIRASPSSALASNMAAKHPPAGIVPGPVCAFCRREIIYLAADCERCYAGPFHLACRRLHVEYQCPGRMVDEKGPGFCTTTPIGARFGDTAFPSDYGDPPAGDLSSVKLCTWVEGIGVPVGSLPTRPPGHRRGVMISFELR